MIQALNRFGPILPMLLGTPERRSHDEVRHGTTSLFAALDLVSGTVTFLERIDAEVPEDLAIHLVLDNHATHKTPAIHRWLLATPGSTSISHRPRDPGSTSWSAGLPN